MTAEHIHDALTLLPADLIAEVDKKRGRKPKVIPWKRYAAMAACFALVLCSGWFCTRLFSPKSAADNSLPETAVMQAAEKSAENFEAAAAEPAAACEEAAPEAAAEDGPAQEERTSEDMQTDITAASGTLYSGMSQPRYVETPPYLGGTACFGGTPAPRLILSRAELEAYQEKTPQRFELDALTEACAGYDDVWFETHDLLLIPLCNLPVGDTPNVTGIYQQDGQWYLCMEHYPDSTEAQRTDWHILLEADKGLVASDAAITLIYE